MSDDLIRRLEHSMATAMNDDLSRPGTDQRDRHIARTKAIGDAIDRLKELETERIGVAVPGSDDLVARLSEELRDSVRLSIRRAIAAADALAPPTGPWSYLRDNEAGPGWDWIVVRPGEGENITDLDEATARMIVRDHNRSVAPAGVPEGWKDKILAVLKENIRLTARTDSESMCADWSDEGHAGAYVGGAAAHAALFQQHERIGRSDEKGRRRHHRR